MMSLSFEQIALDKQYAYLDRFSLCSQKTSDYTFANLWGWAQEYGLRWAWSDELVWIKQTIPEEFNWAPVGLWEDVEWNRSFDEHVNSGAVFTRIPEDLIRLWKESLKHKITIQEARGHWDYLYTVSELIELEGKRFHKKRNLLNQFRKKYNYQFVLFGPEMIDKALAMQQNWCTWRDCESVASLAAENRVISKVFNSWDTLAGLSGGAILVDNEMVAYTLAESLSEDTLVIHFEKGNADFKGVYQAINQMFLEQSGHQFKLVNREQDLDDEGLRKAKLSYNPVGFLKKFQVELM